MRRRLKQTLRLSVRARVMGFMVFLTMLTLVLAGTAAYLLQRADLHRSMDDSLGRTITEFIQRGEQSVNPSTGEPWSTADEFIHTTVSGMILAENESMVAVRDGQVRWFANESLPVRLEDDPEFLTWIESQLPIEEHRIRTAETEQSTYRAVIVPVMMAEDTQPTHFVLAFDVDQGMAALHRTFFTYAGIGAAAVVVTGMLGWLLVGRLLQPVRLLSRTAQSITEEDISRRIPVRTKDDLGELAVTVNQMLDRLETAVTSQRQLLDDVGHELRTPVTIVRGHLELIDAGDPQDVRQTAELAVDELDRMSRLVEDLVTLAKSDQRDFLSVSAADVDLLTEQVFEKAQTLGDREWSLDSQARTVVPLDAQRITQAWLQLAHNAVKFSDPGSAISLGSAVHRTTLYLWAKDAGAGISPEDQETIFSRFSRGSHSQQAEGSGLGLTIVETIARLHGGEVRVESVPEKGSIFTMVLPVAELFELAGQQPEDDDAVHATGPLPVLENTTDRPNR